MYFIAWPKQITQMLHNRVRNTEILSNRTGLIQENICKIMDWKKELKKTKDANHQILASQLQIDFLYSCCK